MKSIVYLFICFSNQTVMNSIVFICVDCFSLAFVRSINEEFSLSLFVYTFIKVGLSLFSLSLSHCRTRVFR